MRFKTLLFVFVIIFTCNDAPTHGWSSLPSLPALSNAAMIKRLTKFYTLQSKSERSDLCKRQSKLLYDGVLNSQFWAVQMIDSSAKLQTGITTLHLSDVGYFDECIQVKNEAESIAGKYCLATIETDLPFIYSNSGLYIDDMEIIISYATKQMMPNFMKDGSPRPEKKDNNLPEMIKPNWAICVPDGCTAKEVQDHLNKFAGINLFSLKESGCNTLETSKSKLTPGDWVVIAFLILLCLLMLLSTGYDVYLFYSKTEPYHQVCIAFSWLTNFQKLVKVGSNHPDMLPCLNGIRFLSMLWIILGHEHEHVGTKLCVNIIYAIDWVQKLFSMLTIGSTVSVDSFFLLSGCLLMFGFLKSQSKKVPFNIPIYYLHRYIRLTPSYAATIVFMITLYRFMGSGPYWDPENNKEPCKTHWWAALLYIQNYVGGECVPQSWYLQIDMQLYVLAPLVLVPIVKWPRITYYLLPALVFIFILIPTIVAWQFKLMVNAGLRQLIDGDDTMETVYYIQTYTRAGPWVLGLLLGYILFNTRNKRIAFNKITIIFLWMVSMAAMLYTIFGFYHENKRGDHYDRVFDSLFIGLHRVVWSAGLSWIIFACTHGYGGPVNWILSLSVFQVLARLAYSMYLTHWFLQSIHIESSQTPFIFSEMQIWYSFCGTLLTCMIVSLVWTLSFESPFLVLDNLLIKLISGGKNKSTSRQKLDIPQEVKEIEQN